MLKTFLLATYFLMSLTSVSAQTPFYQGKTVTIRLNGKEVVKWTQPEDWSGGREGSGRAISQGTFALLGHDPNSTVYYKNIRVKPLP